MSQHRQLRGFTLLELLVVVTAIAIAAGLMLPLFGRAATRGRGAVCKSNVKQLGLAISMYSNDYGGFYPTYGLGRDVGTQDVRGLGSLCLLYDQYITAKKIYKCPHTRDDPCNLAVGMNIDRKVGLITARPAGCSYAYDSQKAGWGRLRPRVGTVAWIPIAADKPDPKNRLGISCTHGNTGQNVLYFDGHVEWANTPNVGLDGDHIWLHWRYDGPRAVLAYSDSYITQ